MSAYGNNVLITFNMIMDIDIGLLHLIKEEYNDPSVFNNDVLNLNDRHLAGLIRENETSNPIDLILLDKDKEQSDSFYNEFISNKYDKILEYSPYTTFVNMIKAFIDSEGVIKVNILCSNKSEEEIVKKVMSDCHPSYYKIITTDDWSSVDLKYYDTMYIKYTEDLLRFNNVMGKNLMVCDYRCNLEESEYQKKNKIPKLEISAPFSVNNEFYNITLYAYDESYYMDTNTEESEEEA
jgi:hypothetical protein